MSPGNPGRWELGEVRVISLGQHDHIEGQRWKTRTPKCFPLHTATLFHKRGGPLLCVTPLSLASTMPVLERWCYVRNLWRCGIWRCYFSGGP